MDTSRLEIVAEAAEIYKNCLDSDLLTFEVYEKSKVPECTANYVTLMLCESAVGFKLCSQSFNNTFLFSVDDPFVKYLHHDPVLGIHRWADESLDAVLDNDIVFNYFMAIKVRNGVFMYKTMQDMNKWEQYKHEAALNGARVANLEEFLNSFLEGEGEND